MVQVEATEQHRELAEEVHDDIDAADPTDVMTLEVTAEQLALLCDTYSVPEDEAKQLILRDIKNKHSDIEVIPDSDESADESPTESTLSPEAQEIAAQIANGEYERTDCSTCGGSGKIDRIDERFPTWEQCGECDNIPEPVIPSNPPANPEAKIEELGERIPDIEAKAGVMEKVQDDISAACDRIDSVTESDYVDDETAAVLSHIKGELSRVIREEVQPRRHKHAQTDLIRKKSRHLRSYQEALERAANNSTDEQG